MTISKSALLLVNLKEREMHSCKTAKTKNNPVPFVLKQKTIQGTSGSIELKENHLAKW